MRLERTTSDAARIRESQADRRLLTIAIVACVVNGIVVLATWGRPEAGDTPQWTAAGFELAWLAFGVGVAIWQFVARRCSFLAIIFTFTIAVAAFCANGYVLAWHTGSA